MGEAREEIRFKHQGLGKVNQILADAIVKEAGTEIALCSSRVVRGDIPKGKVTRKDLFNAVPFTEEDIIVLDIEGKHIRQYIEDRLKDGSRGIAVPAGGLKYTCNPDLPSGGRVTSITVNGKEMKMDEVYTIAVNNSIPVNKNFDTARIRERVDTYQEPFFRHFEAGKVWDNQTDDRVSYVKTKTKSTFIMPDILL